MPQIRKTRLTQIITTKFSRRASSNAQPNTPWTRWATAAEQQFSSVLTVKGIEDWKNLTILMKSLVLLWNLDGRVKINCKKHENNDPSCFVAKVQAAGGGYVALWAILSCHGLCPSIPAEHHLNTTAYVSIGAAHVHLLSPQWTHLRMAESSMSLSSNWFLGHDNEFTVFHCKINDFTKIWWLISIQ